MPGASQWFGELLLHIPPRLRALRDLPLLGNWIHRVSHRILPIDQRVWARIEAGPAQGLWLELNARTGQDYLRSEIEIAVQTILAERLRPGMIFYDLGANIGLFTLLGARLVGETGKVFSFEPDPENATRLRRNIQRNGFTNITIVDSGVWSKTGKLKFVPADAASPDHGTGKFIAAESGPSGTATGCVSLDDYTQSAPWPDAIKCDIEGAEVEALRGAEKFLRAKHPSIVCEMHSPANNLAACEILTSLGYTLEAIDGSHLLAEWR